MKVLYSGSIDVKAGGVATGIYYTMLGLRKHNVDAEIFMCRCKSKLIGNLIPVHYTDRPIIPKIAYSPTYKKDLRMLEEYDLYHAQGIWTQSTYAIIDVAKSYNKPYIITPHGMLYPQAITKSSAFFKKASLKLRLLKDLNNAACIHVTCQQELENCRNLGITSPIAVIPNPVEIKEYTDKKQDTTFRVGYLGRVSPRKNIEGLIYAFATLRNKLNNAELLIIGGGDAEYESFLKSEVERLNLTNVKFTGFLTGEDKDRAIASLSILAMPSEFENHGIVILEGLVRGIPCIATKGSPWEDLVKYQCGWWIDYNQDTLTETIEEAANTPSDKLKIMGENGKLLMEKDYSVNTIGQNMKALYEWILTKDSKPEFVYK